MTSKKIVLVGVCAGVGLFALLVAGGLMDDIEAGKAAGQAAAKVQAAPQPPAAAPPSRTGPPYLELDRKVSGDATGEGFLNLYIRPIATDQQAVKAALQQAHDDFMGKRIKGTDGNPVTRLWVYAYANEYARMNHEEPIGVLAQLGAGAAPSFDRLPQ